MPDYARDYEVTAYLELQGREQRLPLVLKAKGLPPWLVRLQGPAAVFSYDVLDVGDTFANTLHQYEVELQNRGKIDVHFQLVPPTTPFGVKFSFEPAQGLLLGGEIQVGDMVHPGSLASPALQA
ncbi:uncharacterized protein HaLaN_12151 [Haematococcus lacustris]|uniref:HYDIN/VesB/CFA65-like Ig-like domain-containing protein n=1 Tax=Haematococcus lacustris TaxID=44745 RepID=A0A699YZX1_HAELA|nr:uncharacterized protein HaLaN_12151 [Haematococcus lacustris]